MIIRLLSSTNISPRQAVAIVAAIFLLVAGISFGSYYLPEKALTGRRGTLSFIPRDWRQEFVEHRRLVGVAAAGGFGLVATGWLVAERLSHAWQKARNRELAANAVLLRLAPRVDDRSKWQAAVDLWTAVHSSLARPGWQTWLGGGLHFSLEMVQQAGERLTFYLWTPRPVAETLVRQLRATYAGLEIETLVRGDADGSPTPDIDDYLAGVGQEVAWQWADLGLGRESWRPLRTAFAADPLPSLLSTLEGIGPGNRVAVVHCLLRPAAEGWQQGGRAFVSKLRGDKLQPGQPRPRLGSQERELIKDIESKGRGRGYNLCLRLVVGGQGDVGANLDRLIRVFDQFAGDNSLVVRRTGDGSEQYRLQGRFFPAGWRTGVVGPQELAAMAHLPNANLAGVAIARARARVERPSPVSFVGPDEQRLILGRFADVPSFGGGLVELAYPLSVLRRLLKLSTPNGTGPAPNPADNGMSPSIGIPPGRPPPFPRHRADRRG